MAYGEHEVEVKIKPLNKEYGPDYYPSQIDSSIGPFTTLSS